MKTFTLIAILFCINIYAQNNKRKILYDGSFTIVTNKEDTVVFYYYYQNQENNTNLELGVISIFDKDNVRFFAETLKEYAQKEDETDAVYQNKDYSISRFKFSKNIYVSDLNKKYTLLTKKQAILLVNEILNNLYLME